ncbi:hypothetical protein ACFXPW_08380 [Streptomyces goshikiensis]
MTVAEVAGVAGVAGEAGVVAGMGMAAAIPCPRPSLPQANSSAASRAN